MSEEISSQTLPPKTRMNPQDFRNQDLVSRLLAATPPYLYSAPMAPHNFFFSEMLRSLVQAKNNEARDRLQQQATAANHLTPTHHSHHHMGRRPRKRSWSHHRIPFEHHLAVQNKEYEEKVEKPLELTTKMNSTFEGKSSKREQSPTEKLPRFEDAEGEKMQSSTSPPVEQSSTNLTTTPTDLVLPPPPPVWYPSIYPPYGIDPLHFFIDLRVSAGHIRNKDNTSPSSSTTNFRPDNNNSQFFDLESKSRHGSAFSIPTPRETLKSPGAVNLSTTDSEDKDMSKNTNYVMQNLPRIYTHLNQKLVDDQRQDSNETDDDGDVKHSPDEDVIAVDDNDN
ncbi:hypothetical protein DMENIID0001_065120 [Sergentomyia squamirostris]